MLSPIRMLWEMVLPQNWHPLCCSCAQGRGMDRGVRGWHRGWLQADVPDPEHPQLRGGTKTVTVRAIRACLIMMHTGKDGREEERSGVLFASWQQQAWAS